MYSTQLTLILWRVIFSDPGKVCGAIECDKLPFQGSETPHNHTIGYPNEPDTIVFTQQGHIQPKEVKPLVQSVSALAYSPTAFIFHPSHAVSAIAPRKNK